MAPVGTTACMTDQSRRWFRAGGHTDPVAAAADLPAAGLHRRHGRPVAAAAVFWPRPVACT